ncbi:putative monooxygenase [Xylariales sp. AK1849]|nr:putative monooxygenase [Xylariales sp. AK1849]
MATAATSPPTPTGIRVLIVGAGFAGLTAAIECHRHGHTPIILEKFPELKLLGDIISFAPNSSRIFQRWPGVAERLEPIAHRPKDGLTFKSWRGETLYQQSWSKEEQEWGIRYDGHRGEFHEIVYHHAVVELGIEVKLGARVVDYFEGATEAGVVLQGGERIVGDVVLAAEGVRSKGRTTVLGYEDAPKASGYAVYRAWFDTKGTVADDPSLDWLIKTGDKHVAWLGPDIHFIAAILKNGQDISWVCTHKDDKDIEESWQHEAPLSDAREVLKGWEDNVQRILDNTPEPLIDWKLVYRDPLPTWISPKRRIALIGDAAHPFLPTSIQGASQAMEDGSTIAVCLRRAGKGNIRDAVEVFEALRYHRVKSAQKTGEQTRDIWHKADFTTIKQNPDSLRLRREAWLLNFDAETYAEQEYERTRDVVKEKGVIAGRELHLPEGRFGYLEYDGAHAASAKEPSL